MSAQVEAGRTGLSDSHPHEGWCSFPLLPDLQFTGPMQPLPPVDCFLPVSPHTTLVERSICSSLPNHSVESPVHINAHTPWTVPSCFAVITVPGNELSQTLNILSKSKAKFPFPGLKTSWDVVESPLHRT